MHALVFNMLYPLILSLMIVLPVANLCFVKNNIRALVIYTFLNYCVLALTVMYKSTSGSFFFCNLSSSYLIASVLIYIFIVYRNLTYALITSIFILISNMISDGIVGAITIVVFNIEYEGLSNNYPLYSIIGIAILFTTTIISLIFRIVALKMSKKYINFKKYGQIGFLSIFVLATMLGIFLIYIYLCGYLLPNWDSRSISLHMILIIFLSTVCLTMLYSVTKAIKNMFEQEYKEKEYSQLKEYTDLLENVSTDLRKFKHDYINILLTLGGYIDEGDLNGLKEFYNKDLLPETGKHVTKNKNLSLLQHIKTSPLKALLSSKLITSQSHNIETRIELIDDIDNIPMNTIDICRIIGILLDNAIEAADLCEKKSLHFAGIKTDDSIIFIVRNSCLPDTPPVYKIYEKDFSTKGDGHGIGLKTVREIINRDYKNVILNTKIENCIFSQELIINL
ncbi:signal transduction histidine kinase regulating citrate/malate metabolism [Clostridium bornimense]|uniref:Signal transduction histidine kinase regulating citrate/malate metabolism n=1 Tax=Clostridium bornimense TaxID=1216932 RepID=W6RV11_9CLOT|nr:sensor histidine kinase [Clostridium bornimense]CDM68168.1 signal transduction histidine kinase regulating citrate/malate metabolism [Clostridium bornimense]